MEPNPRRWGANPYFLNLWIDGNSTSNDVDDFLRDIWLECCGHMSGFTNPKKQKTRRNFNFFELDELPKNDFQKSLEDINDEILNNIKTKEVLHKDLLLNYDYGSTTSLQLTVAGEYPVQADTEIVLLSRNEPCEILCSHCGKKAATKICTDCMHHGDAVFCTKCTKIHAKSCSEYVTLPVVNSPRMGICSYEGGRIDTERDIWTTLC